MAFRSLAASLYLAFLLPFVAQAKAPQTSQTAHGRLTITCDADCNWSVDNDQHGGLKKGEKSRVEVLFGAHRIEATSSDGKHWEQTIEIKQPNQQQIQINFSGSAAREEAQIEAAPAYRALQTKEPASEIPRFYAQARQVLVEADVWNKSDKKNDALWIPKELLKGLPKVDADYIIDVVKHSPPPARGLNQEDFHVFDNGVEQRINYFKETDFLGIDTSGEWRYQPTPDGIWGASLGGGPALEPPSATYLIGYVPPPLKPAECRTIGVIVSGREVDLSRNRYCSLENAAQAEAPAPRAAGVYNLMRNFAASGKRGSLQVSMHALVLWSSGVLSLIGEAATTANDAILPATHFTYVVEVHDSKAPATVQIATDFVLPLEGWDVWHCLDKNPDALYVLGTVYKESAVAGEFSGRFGCGTGEPAIWDKLFKAYGAFFLVPSRFDTQIELLPGDYELRAVISDGRKFGQAEIPLRVEPFAPRQLATSDVVLSSFVRDASWVPREAAAVSPAPVIPTPLVSKDVQFFPEVQTQLRKGSPLYLYFEIYEPDPEEEKTPPNYSIRVRNVETGALVMDIGPMSAADFVISGTSVIAVGLKLETGKLRQGSYRIEVQASDAVGQRSKPRSAAFSIK